MLYANNYGQDQCIVSECLQVFFPAIVVCKRSVYPGIIFRKKQYMQLRRLGELWEKRKIMHKTGIFKIVMGRVLCTTSI